MRRSGSSGALRAGAASRESRPRLRMLRLNGAMLAAGAVVVAVQWLRS
jgi:hypothetical protein